MLFPKWADRVGLLITVVVPILLIGGISAFAYFISPYSTQVGYAPKQPVPYSHKVHAGDLGIDCRYCHTGVETSPYANVPAAETCMNCHTQILKDSPNVLPIKESFLTGEPLEWIRIHRLPQFAYFNHSIHVKAGIGCADCHGRIDHMDVVYQAKPLNMAWCLDCHRAPEKYLRPRDQITNMNWKAEDQMALGLQLKAEYDINPTTNCSGCHR
jgi:hypothetical protein